MEETSAKEVLFVRLFNSLYDDAVAMYNAAFLYSDDLGEAVAAFMQKRAPSFKGR